MREGETFSKEVETDRREGETLSKEVETDRRDGENENAGSRKRKT